MAEIMNFFPLTIYTGMVEEHEQLKAQLAPRVQAMVDGQGHPQSAWTGDMHGHGFLHLEDGFGQLFDALLPHIHNYLDALDIRPGGLDLFVQRSWPVVTQRGQVVSMHRHEQSHISLVYYLAKPPESGGLRFTMESAPNEVAPRLFDDSLQRFKTRNTPLNCNIVDLDTEEGQVLVFPSKALHATLPSEADADRISISADIALMLRDDNNFEHLLPAFSRWRRLG